MKDAQYNQGNLAEEYLAHSLFIARNDPGRQFIYESLGENKSASILDIGCGPGIDILHFKELGFSNLSGTDPSSKLFNEVKSKINDVNLQIGEFEAIPFEDKSFDIATSRFAMHYTQNLDKAFIEVGRVLKDGGKIVFVVSYPFADSLEERDNDGDVIDSVFNKQVVVTFPLHKISDYFSETFLKLFSLEKIFEYTGHERDGYNDNIPNALCFVARKKQS